MHLEKCLAMKQKVKLDEYEQEELRIATERMGNPYYFENLCGACDNFETDECPFIGKVTDITEWRKIRCTKFWD